MSEGSQILKRAVDEYSKEIAREEDKKIQIALDNTMERVRTKVEEYIQIMSQAYYDGYDPIWYVRTMQLQKSSTRPINPYAEIKTFGNMSNLSFGVVFDETSMDHGSYTIKARWYDKKSKKWKDVKKRKTYNVTPGKKSGKKPNEERIMKFFQEGLHPNMSIEGITEFPTPMPLFTEGLEGFIPELIDEWLEGRELQRIFTEELKKLY